MQRSKFSTGRIRRWLQLIQEFDIEIEHVKGKENIVADILTRHPQHMPNVREKPEEVILASIMRKKLDNDVIKVLKNLKQLQGEDEEIKKLKIKAEEEDEGGGEKTTYKIINDVLCKKNIFSVYMRGMSEK